LVDINVFLGGALLVAPFSGGIEFVILKGVQ